MLVLKVVLAFGLSFFKFQVSVVQKVLYIL